MSLRERGDDQVSNLMPLEETNTVNQVLHNWADATPNRVALTARSGFHSSVRSITYRELRDRAVQGALALWRLGVRKGDRVAFICKNTAGIEAVELYYASHLCGAIVAPLNYNLTAHELQPLLVRAQPRVVMFEASFRDRLDNAQIDPHCALIQLDGDVDWIEAGRDRPAAVQSAPRAVVGIDPSDPADWLFTSGTTGVAKCVELSHRSIWAHSIMFSKSLGLRADDDFLSVFPFFTSSGVHTSLLTALGAGAHYIMANDVAVDALIELMERYHPTVAAAVPSIFTYITRRVSQDARRFESVRMILYGGAAVPPSEIEGYMRVFPRAEIVNTYGQTECGNPGTYLPGKFALTRPGSIGQGGMYGVATRVVDGSGKVVSSPGVGELLLRSEAVMTRYVDDVEATTAVLRDGWLHTGDLVRVDADGFLYIHDRLKDTVNRGGHNISSIEVENALSRHPAVLEAAVVAKEHPELGEDLVAFIVAEAGASPSAGELRDFCQDYLAPYKIPRDFRFVEQLPRNPTGKILKRQLREGIQGTKSEGLEASKDE